MTVDRRSLLTASLGLTAGTAAVLAGPRTADAAQKAATTAGLLPNDARDQTAALQAAIDASAARGEPFHLPPGRFRVGHLVLRPGTALVGAHGKSVLEFTGGPAFVTAEKAGNLRLEGLTLDGGSLALDPGQSRALLAMTSCSSLVLSNVTFTRSLIDGLAMTACSGKVADCTFTHMSQAAIRSVDAAGLDILHNYVADCANNGIQVWRQTPGEDATIVSGNRIERIGAKSGGSGEYGNGINVFRAGGVLVSANRISDCAYSAIRGNAASNIQMTSNSCARIGEVALYAEFAFEGAVIASNLVEDAASGIEVTNFDEGGRLAIVQGNMIRRLHRREHEPVDKRGDGIGVEADSIVSGNVVEDAANAGIVVGWGEFMRNCQVVNNLVRRARYGILVTREPAAGACLIASNMIVEAPGGAIRSMDRGIAEGLDLTQKAPTAGRLAVTGNIAVS